MLSAASDIWRCARVSVRSQMNRFGLSPRVFVLGLGNSCFDRFRPNESAQANLSTGMPCVLNK